MQKLLKFVLVVFSRPRSSLYHGRGHVLVPTPSIFFPVIDLPTITVTVVNPRRPQEIETEITDKVEGAVTDQRH
jgi:hypothetical protein